MAKSDQPDWLEHALFLLADTLANPSIPEDYKAQRDQLSSEVAARTNEILGNGTVTAGAIREALERTSLFAPIFAERQAQFARIGEAERAARFTTHQRTTVQRTPVAHKSKSKCGGARANAGRKSRSLSPLDLFIAAAVRERVERKTLSKRLAAYGPEFRRIECDRVAFRAMKVDQRSERERAKVSFPYGERDGEDARDLALYVEWHFKGAGAEAIARFGKGDVASPELPRVVWLDLSPSEKSAIYSAVAGWLSDEFGAHITPRAVKDAIARCRAVIARMDAELEEERSEREQKRALNKRCLKKRAVATGAIPAGFIFPRVEPGMSGRKREELECRSNILPLAASVLGHLPLRGISVFPRLY